MPDDTTRLQARLEAAQLRLARSNADLRDAELMLYECAEKLGQHDTPWHLVGKLVGKIEKFLGRNSMATYGKLAGPGEGEDAEA